MTKPGIKDEALRKEIGLRFKEFRQAIKKTRHELVDELKICQSTISSIETGKCFPGITIQSYLYRQYHLNINWLLTGSGEMIISPEEDSKTAYISQLFSYIDENDPRFEKFVELFSLMRIPAIERVILGKLAEIKALAKEEIESFFEGT